MTEYCCGRFQDLVSDGSHRGMAIVPQRHEKFGYNFVLRFRALDSEFDNELVEVGDVPVTRTVEQAIIFCPWCGKHLLEFYDSQMMDSFPVVDVS